MAAVVVTVFVEVVRGKNIRGFRILEVVSHIMMMMMEMTMVLVVVVAFVKVVEQSKHLKGGHNMRK